jgi:16S rRNA (uracil1498-N3)-methyltransferase
MIRLHLSQPLSSGAVLAPTLDQSRYLTQVMRLKTGDDVAVFNGRDGEWRCTIAEVLKKGVLLRAEDQIRPQTTVPDVHLLIAVVKKSALEFAVEKATELGAARIRLVQTGRMDVPLIDAPQKLDAVLDGWDASRRLMFCDETGGAPAVTALHDAGEGAWAILIGPEGGFTSEEGVRLRALPYATAVSLGPRILRADTAATTALSLWQAAIGDWAR